MKTNTPLGRAVMPRTTKYMIVDSTAAVAAAERGATMSDNPFDEEDHTPTIDSMEVLAAVREGARPSWSPELDRLMINAARNGWTAETLTTHLVKDIGGGAGAGVTMMLLRRLTSGPPPKARPADVREPQIIGHSPCNEPHHGPSCQVCSCNRKFAEHIVITPMPDWFREQFHTLFARFGRIPE